VHFESQLQTIGERDAASKIYQEFSRKIISVGEVRSCEAALSPMVRELKSCGINATCAARFKLGWDATSRRITIPIFDRFGHCTNIRYYRLPQHRDASTKVKIYNKDGYGYLEIFPWQEIKKFTPDQPVIWMKAEKDTMLAIQMGYQAFCLTNGEGAWLDELPEIFQDYDIVLCGDNDAAGKTATTKHLNEFKSHNIDARVVRIPKPHKDFADWVVAGHGTREEFDELLGVEADSEDDPVSHPSPSGKHLGFTLPTYYDEAGGFQHLIDVGRDARLLNRICKVRAIVSGKLDRTYTVPYKFRVSSTACPARDFTLPLGRELLNLVRSSDEAIAGYVRTHLLKNSKAKLDIIGHISISELELIPAVTPEFESPYVTQKCFYVGDNIETNVPYEMEIVPTTEVRSQETVGLVIKAIPISKAITDVDFSPEELAALRSFQSEGEGGCFKSVLNLVENYATHFSQVFNRPDWHMVALLTWASPLQFFFPGEGIQRGWLNTLVLGDTETGKSKLVKSIQQVTNSGVFVNAENCTYVGLVGGAIKTGTGQFMLRWGKIPLNNRQLVIIEELSGLSIEEISNLSEVRSSGLARLDKGGLSSETSARTRLICLSNVRGRNKTLAGYISGVRAVQDLIGHGEDISRFDFICTLTDREVSAETINQPREIAKGRFIDLNSFKLLIRFIWSLKAEQIVVTKKAYLLCLTETTRLGKIYHPSIPLFKAGSGRMKLARIACAFACLTFNWNGEKVVVDTQHVQAAVQLLEMLYNKQSCGYLDYSEQMYYRETIEAEEGLLVSIKTHLNPGSRVSLFKYLLHAGRFTIDELGQVAGIQNYPAGQVLGKMVNSNIIRKGDANVWEVTPAGKDWLQKQAKNGSLLSPLPSPPLQAKVGSLPIVKNKLVNFLKQG